MNEVEFSSFLSPALCSVLALEGSRIQRLSGDSLVVRHSVFEQGSELKFDIDKMKNAR